MGGELSRMRSFESIMTGLADAASGMLDPAEREVVSGDLAESGESGWQALRQVLSLVVRRHVLSLKSVGPWLVLATLAIPTAFLLSLVARQTADGSAIYLWMWINNSDWTIIQSAGFWQLVREYSPDILFSYVVLACCSWTSGLLIGWSARRTRWLSGLVLFAVVLAVGVLGAPRSFAHILVLQRARDFQGNAAVFLAVLYRQILPGTLEIFFVILPAWWGMRSGSKDYPIWARRTRSNADLLHGGAWRTRQSESPLVANAGLGSLAAPFSPSSIACTAGACSTGSVPRPDDRPSINFPPRRARAESVDLSTPRRALDAKTRKRALASRKSHSQNLHAIHR